MIVQVSTCITQVTVQVRLSLHNTGQVSQLSIYWCWGNRRISRALFLTPTKVTFM